MWHFKNKWQIHTSKIEFTINVTNENAFLNLSTCSALTPLCTTTKKRMKERKEICELNKMSKNPHAIVIGCALTCSIDQNHYTRKLFILLLGVFVCFALDLHLFVSFSAQFAVQLVCTTNFFFVGFELFAL